MGKSGGTSRPRALTIAGSDPSGGAGIQADLKTFAALGVEGAAAITVLTAQTSKKFHGVADVDPVFVAHQIDAALEEAPVAATKSGMLGSAAVLTATCEAIERHSIPNLVVDPVLRSTTGESLFDATSIDLLRESLIPLATIVTPNVEEAAALMGEEIEGEERIKQAAMELYRLGAKAVLITGGPAPSDEARAKSCDDLFYDGDDFEWLRGSRLPLANTHGTGCTLSAAIAGYLARGRDLRESVHAAKVYVTRCIEAGIARGDGLGLERGFGAGEGRD